MLTVLKNTTYWSSRRGNKNLSVKLVLKQILSYQICKGTKKEKLAIKFLSENSLHTNIV